MTLLLLVMATGCGFQLRGQASLPSAMDTTWLAVPDATSEFARELALLLRGNGVTLADAPGQEAAELRILEERITRRALTISGDARVREFEVVFDLRFSLTAADGEVLLPPESLRLERDFQFDEQEILGAATEEELLREDLRRSMAAALIRRLEAYGRS
jgi:LPS-assembly lipoprotein